MKNKKVLAFSMILCLIFSLFATGCTSKTDKKANSQSVKTEGKKDDKGTNKETNKESVEIDIFQFKVEVAQALEEAARAYEKINSNVKINIQTVGGGDDYGVALKAKFQSRQEPDIFNVGGPQDIEDWMDSLEDLSDQPWVDLALPGMLSGATVDNKVYALPFNLEGYGFIYNKRIFKDAGIDGSAIKDFASLEKAVQTLDAKIKAGDLKDKYPLLEAVFEMPAKEAWVTGLHASNVVLSQEFSSSLESYAAKEVEFKHADALQDLIDLQANYSSNPNAKEKLVAVDYATQVDEGIAIERVAIIQQGNWIYGGVADIDKEVAENLDILPMPVKGGKEDCIPVGVPMHWSINKDSSDLKKLAAKDFLNWLYTSDEGKDFVVNKFFFIPPLQGYEHLEPQDALGKAVKRYSEEGKTTPWVFMGYPTAWGEKVLGLEIQRYLATDVTWEEIIKIAKEKWAEMR